MREPLCILCISLKKNIKMKNDLDYKKSYWRSELYEFCEEAFVNNRKAFKLTQKRISSILGLNQSEISRIERGVTTPKDITTIEAICAAYRLTPAQRSKYLELTYGLPTNNTSDLLSELVDTQTAFIANLNRSGSPMLAIKQSENLREWLENNIVLANGNNANIKDKICHLLLEESAAWWDVMVPDKTQAITEPLIEKMEKFSEEDKSSLSKDYLLTNKGFHSYIKGDNHEAKDYFEKVINSELLKGKLWGYEVLRAYTVTVGKLKDAAALSRAENRIYQLVQDPKIDDTQKGYLLEGLGQAYINLNHVKSQNFFDAAYKHINEARKNPNFLNIRYVQLTRSYLLFLNKIASNTVNLLDVAKSALDETEKSGFVRHQQQIQQLIK